MVKKEPSKKPGDKEKRERTPLLREETFHTVLSIVFFLLALFFLLSPFGKAGVAGQTVHSILETLAGLGYFLLPVLFILLGVSFFKSEKPAMATRSIVGSFLFIVAGLGLIQILLGETYGGIIGRYASLALVALFDTYLSLAIFSAIVIISLLVIFDARPSLESLRQMLGLLKKRNAQPMEDVKIAGTTETPSTVEIKAAESKEGLEKSGATSTPPKKRERTEEESFADELLGGRGRHQHDFTPPPLSLLESDRGKPGVGDIKANANIIKRTLAQYGITVEMDEVFIGPSVTRYTLKPAEGVKLGKIVGLQNELSYALAAHPIRIEAPIPGQSLVGIEVPNSTKTTVGLGTLLSAADFQNSPYPLFASLGKSITGKSHFANLAKMPHLLIAGATGSGKSVMVHSMIVSLLYRNPPESLRFIMIDPKRVELTLYNGIPHLLTPVITDAKKSIMALRWAAKEMDRRYDVLEAESVRDIESYHKNVWAPFDTTRSKKGRSAEDESSAKEPERMPYIVVIIDELADIMQAYPRELEAAIVRLAQMSRAVGIHLILSTQRPSVNVITGLIKANVPSRIALQVTSQIDSRTILDTGGAEKLLGAGDMLYMSGDMSKPIRIQSAFISESETKKVVKFLKEEYRDEAPEEVNLENLPGKNVLFEASLEDDPDAQGEDDKYEEAREEVIRSQKASTSYLQRKLGVGYARAARIIDMLEERGVIGAGEGAKPREVLVKVGEDTPGEIGV